MIHLHRLAWRLRWPLERIGEWRHMRWHDRHDRGTATRLRAGLLPECEDPRCPVCGPEGRPRCGWCLNVLREVHR
jgi:hypothetical protein